MYIMDTQDKELKYKKRKIHRLKTTKDTIIHTQKKI